MACLQDLKLLVYCFVVENWGELAEIGFWI